MNKDNKFYKIIEKLVRQHRKFPGCEAILDDIINDVYSHSEVILNSVTNENVINSYLEKVISTSIITVPKKLNFNRNVKHTVIKPSDELFSNKNNDVEVENEPVENIIKSEPRANTELVDKMINSAETPVVSKSDESVDLNTVSNSISSISEETEDDNEIFDLDNLSVEENQNDISSKNDAEADILDGLFQEDSSVIEEEKSIENNDDFNLNDLDNMESGEESFNEENVEEIVVVDEKDSESGISVSQDDLSELVEKSEENVELTNNNSYEEIENISDEEDDVSVLEISENIEDVIEESSIENMEEEELLQIDNSEDFGSKEVILDINNTENEDLLNIQELDEDGIQDVSSDEFSDEENIQEEAPILQEATPILQEDLDTIDAINNDGEDDLLQETDSAYSEDDLLSESDLPEVSLSEMGNALLEEEPELLSETEESDFGAIETPEEASLIDFSESSESESLQNNKVFEKTNYSIFTPTSDLEKDNEEDLQEISNKLSILEEKYPSENIIKVFDMKYKQNSTIDDIHNELGMSKEDVISTLLKIVELV